MSKQLVFDYQTATETEKRLMDLVLRLEAKELKLKKHLIKELRRQEDECQYPSIAISELLEMLHEQG